MKDLFDQQDMNDAFDPVTIFCTLDRKFPVWGAYVVFEVRGSQFLGGCETHDDKSSTWFTTSDDEHDYYPASEPIYWKYVGNLSYQYQIARR